MTMIDEGVLTEALLGAAESIDIPDGAANRLLRAARPDVDDPEPLAVPFDQPNRRRRMVLVAASLILLVCAVTVVSVRATNSPTKDPAIAGPTTATTIPSPAASGAPALGVPGSAGSTSSGKGATSNNSYAASAPTATGGTPATTIPPLPSAAVGQSPKIESKGTMQLTVGHGKLHSALAALTTIAGSAGGLVASTQAQSGSGSGGAPSGTIVLRVPQSAFSSVLKQVENVGHVSSVSTTATDVTGQYVDLQARLAALEASRQQYLTIMSHATSIGDVLAVQSQLDTLQSQIEQLQGQLNVLDSQTTYGSLTVSLAEAGHPAPQPVVPRSGLISAWHSGVGGFVSGFEWLIRAAGPTLFILLVTTMLVLLVRWGWRFTRRRML
jgi:Domain of unknown function (DUF4349)